MTLTTLVESDLAERADDIRARLFKDRIVFLGSPINDEIAWDLIDSMNSLAELDPTAPVSLYVNSPGGAVNASLRIVRAMDSYSFPVTTINVGKCVGSAAMIVAHGASGSRLALPTSTFQLVPATRFGSDVSSAAARLPEIQEEMAVIFAQDCGRSLDEVSRSIRERFVLDAYRAQTYRLIDHVIKK